MFDTTEESGDWGGGDCGNASSPDTAFVFTADLAGSYRFSPGLDAGETVLSAREGVCAGSEISCEEESGSLDVALEANEQVTVVIGGEDGSVFGTVWMEVERSDL